MTAIVYNINAPKLKIIKKNKLTQDILNERYEHVIQFGAPLYE